MNSHHSTGRYHPVTFAFAEDACKLGSATRTLSQRSKCESSFGAMATSWALLLAALPLGQHAHAAGPVGLALDTTCTNAECYMQRNMTLLKQALLTGYDMTVQPPRFGSERGALVSVQLAMQQFQKLDTTNQEITFFSWWRHSWTDPRLAWDPADCGGITELTFFGTAAA